LKGKLDVRQIATRKIGQNLSRQARTEEFRSQDGRQLRKDAAMLESLHGTHRPVFPRRWELIKANMAAHAQELYPDNAGKHEVLITELLCMRAPHKVRADNVSWECWGCIVQKVHMHVHAVHPDDPDKAHRLELKLLGYL
jgi:hypothetical protein